MKTEANIVQFPVRPKRKERRVRKLGGIKYFNVQQIKALRRAARDQADLDLRKGKVTGVRDWMAIDLLTATGMRVSEAADLCCGDLKLGYAESKVFIREGKGCISADVVINESLKKHLKHFLAWKAKHREPTGDDDPLFTGQRGKWTRQAIQQLVKKYLKKLDLYETGKSVHALRHSYAVELYSKERDIRAVQKQLRHLSLQSTQVYADVTDEDLKDQVKGLWQ